MANKFRGQPLQPPQPKKRQESPVGDFGSVEGSKSPAILPVETGAKVEHVKVERGELRKDVGWTHLGEPIGTIIGLFEHKWIFGNEVLAKVLRIFNLDGVTRSQYWDGTTWVEGPQASEPLASVYLSEVSEQGLFLMADGRRIFKWEQQVQTTDYGHDFPSGSILDLGDSVEDCTGDFTISPGGAVDDKYTIHADFIWDNIPTDQSSVVELILYVNGFEIGTRTFRYTPPDMTFDPTTQDEEDMPEAQTTQAKEINLYREIYDGDTFHMCLGPNSSMGSEDELTIGMYENNPNGTFFTLPVPTGVNHSRSVNEVVFTWVNTLSDASIQCYINTTGVYAENTADFQFTEEIAPEEVSWYSGQPYYNVYRPYIGAIRYHRGNQYSPWVPVWGDP